jgi:hypothetical protein
MKLNSEELRSLYQRETARSNRRSDCLTEEVLARAVARELDQPERERIADHLASCSDCAKEYRAAKSIKSWADENAGSRHRPFYLPYAIASLLLLSVVLGALLISKLRENQRLVAAANNHTAESRRLVEESTRRAEQESAARRAAEEELARRDAVAKSANHPKQSPAPPQANVPIIDLNPQDAGRGGQNSKAATVQLSPDTDLFTLILNLSGEDSSRKYSLQVTDRNNRTIWSTRDLRKSPYNNFTVVMRRRLFPPGEYRLKIYGDRRQLIEEYAFRLSY